MRPIQSASRCGEVVVHRDDVDALAGQRIQVRRAASTTSVLPSPVRISAILPLCSAMPPSSCTSKWRMPSVRLPASRTTANASGSTSSSDAPSLTRLRNSSVLARSASSESAAIAGSSALIARTCWPYCLEQPLVAAAEDAGEDVRDHSPYLGARVAQQTGCGRPSTALQSNKVRRQLHDADLEHQAVATDAGIALRPARARSRRCDAGPIATASSMRGTGPDSAERRSAGPRSAGAVPSNVRSTRRWRRAGRAPRDRLRTPRTATRGRNARRDRCRDRSRAFYHTADASPRTTTLPLAAATIGVPGSARESRCPRETPSAR